MKRKDLLFHPLPLKNHVYITRKHPSRYCKKVIDLLKEFDFVELYASGAAINTLCNIKIEIERQLYLPIDIPTLTTKIHCEVKTYSIMQDKVLNGMNITVRKTK